MRERFQIGYNCSLRLKDELITFWRSKVKLSRSHYFALFWTQYIRNAQRECHYMWHIHLDSRMNWIELGCQRSRLLWYLQYVLYTLWEFTFGTDIHLNLDLIFQLDEMFSNLVQTFTWTQRWPHGEVKGQGHSDVMSLWMWYIRTGRKKLHYISYNSLGLAD